MKANLFFANVHKIKLKTKYIAYKCKIMVKSFDKYKNGTILNFRTQRLGFMPAGSIFLCLLNNKNGFGFR